MLTSAFKSSIDDNGKAWSVTESRAYLEISNGNETVTVYRSIKSESRDNHLITVYYGDLGAMADPRTISGDFYVNYPNAATGPKGFHAYLEEFLHLDLPLVRTSDGNERKLYLQVVFSSMFIEQKHGWSDILSGMPIFGIRESRKRVVEYILGLDTLRNERERERLSGVRALIERNWEELVTKIQMIAHAESCDIVNVPLHPNVLTENNYSRIGIRYAGAAVSDEIDRLRAEYAGLRQLKPRVLDNFDALHSELTETEATIHRIDSDLCTITTRLVNGNEIIARLTSDLEIINSDIRNNEDAARLQRFGSEATGVNLSVDVCPTCKQHIQDNLLLSGTESGFMSIEENIRHLKEQKKMLDFSLDSRQRTYNEFQLEKQQLETKLETLRRLAYTLRSDLYTTTDTEFSEAIMLKRIEISSRIERLTKLQNTVAAMLEQLRELSSQWNSYINQKAKLPRRALSDSDEEKVELLKKKFIGNLRRYHYSSLSSFDGIGISTESLLPTIDGFDMKFDSSASDGIRVIWAFTMALLQVSIEKDGNHPGIIVFDEPAQQSIVPADMENFINSAAELGKSCQIITAITLNSQELIGIIDGLEPDSYHRINISGKAFKLFA